MIFDLIVLAASGPVRLFTPYKRRRRNQINHHDTLQTKIKKQSEEDSENDQAVVTKVIVVTAGWNLVSL